MQAPKTIILKGNPIRGERLAAAAITPGHLLELISTNKVRVHSIAGGTAAKIFALEMGIVGDEITTAYAADDTVLFGHLCPGMEFYALLPANAPAVVIGDKLESNGDGALRKQLVTAASLNTGVVGNNNAITYTSKLPGVAGNDISIALVDPSGNSQALAISVAGNDISISLETSAAGAITSTPATIIAAIAADSAASKLVSAANQGASTGAAAVAAVAATHLTGGVGYDLTGSIVAIALEAVDNSAGATSARIRALAI